MVIKLLIAVAVIAVIVHYIKKYYTSEVTKVETDVKNVANTVTSDVKTAANTVEQKL